MKIPKLVKFFFIFFLISTLQLSVVPLLPEPLNILNLTFSFLIFITIMVDVKQGMWWSLAFGLFYDYFGVFEATTISFVMTLFCTYLLFELIFTNKSLYSLIFLAFLGNILFHLFFIVFTKIFSSIRGTGIDIVLSSDLYAHILRQSLFTILLLFIAWKIINMFSRRFKIVFLSAR